MQPPSRRRPGPLRGLVFLALLLSASACGEEPVPSPPAAVHLRRAWTGEAGDGLRVVLEALPHAELEAATGWSEAALLRREFGLGDEVLLELHLIGPVDRLGDPGTVSGSRGEPIGRPLGPPPPGLDPQARSLWLALAGGRALPTAGTARRSFLILAPSLPDGERLSWSRGGERLDLVARSWTGRERQDFLTPGRRRAVPEDHPSLEASAPAGEPEEPDRG
ncbi:MAG: hypothetical protein D6702_09505 [Planctomycetota bacterium]|nr:MAG: hypothetical protein D6702_09505 [Planctomycetota bacterium]